MTAINFKTLRAQNLPVGKVVVAQIWLTKTRRIQKLVRVQEVHGHTVSTGIEVVTNEFVATTIPGTCWMGTEYEGKTCRVTFGLPKGMTTQLLLPAPAEAEAKKVRVRKPLTRAQKDRKNELARLRRAKAK